MVDRTEAVKELKKVKDKVRKIINQHQLQASKLAPHVEDPFLPVIGVVQMAFVQACMEYLIDAGCAIPRAADTTISTTGKAMEAWVKQLQKGAGMPEASDSTSG